MGTLKHVEIWVLVTAHGSDSDDGDRAVVHETEVVGATRERAVQAAAAWMREWGGFCSIARLVFDEPI